MFSFWVEYFDRRVPGIYYQPDKHPQFMLRRFEPRAAGSGRRLRMNGTENLMRVVVFRDDPGCVFRP